MATVGYARVSSVGQSLEAQKEALQHCDKMFVEKASAKNRDRPVLEKALDYVREGDTLICTRLDRIARSTGDLLSIVDQLQEKGVRFKLLQMDLDTNTATGKLILTTLGAIATFERELMLERQAEGIARAKSEGKYKGRKPTAMEKKPEALRLKAEGFNPSQISRKLGVSRSSVYRALA